MGTSGFEYVRWKGKWWQGKRLKKLVLFIRRSGRVTCADCGFLAYGNDEAHKVSRVLLAAEGRHGLPGGMETLQCYRSLWVNYDLTYSGHSIEGQLEEVNNRRHCEGFLRYKPGLSPGEHKQRLAKSEERKSQFKYTLLAAVLAAILALVGQTGQQWLAKVLGLSTLNTTSTRSKK